MGLTMWRQNYIRAIYELSSDGEDTAPQKPKQPEIQDACPDLGVHLRSK